MSRGFLTFPDLLQFVQILLLCANNSAAFFTICSRKSDISHFETLAFFRFSVTIGVSKEWRCFLWLTKLVVLASAAALVRTSAPSVRFPRAILSIRSMLVPASTVVPALTPAPTARLLPRNNQFTIKKRVSLETRFLHTVLL